MSAVQAVPGIHGVVETYSVPRTAGMTGIAGVTKVTVMTVIVPVTGDATGLQSVRERIIAVTIRAAQSAVATDEIKSSVSAMIEARVAPAKWRMAVVTLLAAAAVVNIVRRVAAITCRGRAEECLVLVTAAATCASVFADQREARAVVVEFSIQPAGCTVAISTGGAHGLAVRIVRFVAGEAIGRRVTVPGVRFVTISTVRVEVASQQVKVGECVIEYGLDESNDIGIPSLVICVTSRAGLVRGTVIESVEAMRS